MKKDPLIVAIGGGSCSGKSTLSKRIEEGFKDRYKTRSFMMDMYWQTPGPTVIAPITGVEYPERNHPDALDLKRFYEELEQALNGGEFDIVVIEGLFALQIERTRNMADFKIFVDLKSDERLYRRIKRWMALGQTMDEVASRFLDTVRFRHDELVEPSRWYADVVVNGILERNNGTQVVNRFIEHLMHAKEETRKASC